jgi:raffinose/stachyose/melibiose transport system substrate-binding protein
METTASVAEMNSNVGFFPISPTGNIGTYEPDQSNAVSAPIAGNATQEAAARQFIDFWLTTDYKSFITANKDVVGRAGRRLAVDRAHRRRAELRRAERPG